MLTFYSPYPYRLVCFSSDGPSACTAIVADVDLQGIKLYIPSFVVSIGGNSQSWFDTSCTLATFIKREAYQT